MSRRLAPRPLVIVVPKAVDKRATRRNRMKRLIREAVRTQKIVAPPGTMIMVRRPLPDTQQEVNGLVRELFPKT